MRFGLGIPESLAGAPLPRRLLWLNAVRLLVLLMLLALMGYTFLGGALELGTFSSQLALATLAASFALTGASTMLLRRLNNIEGLAHSQLVADQLTWTVFVYLSGAMNSGATPFYGLTCLAGAITTGLRGAWLAAAAAVVSYGAVALGFWQGWLQGPSDQSPELYRYLPEDIAYHFGINLLGIVVVTLLGAYLAERLRLTGGRLVEAEERAERAERLAALGRLATGLAHEIRNPLGSIAGSVRLLGTSSGLTDEDRELCLIIQREAGRLNELITDMMDLTRPREPTLSAVDVVPLVKEVVALATASGRAASDVTVCYLGQAGPVIVEADAAQLRQLIWNLVRNAVQASAASDVVQVRLECRQDSHAILSVTDYGTGIEPEALPRLFDAFFTTRTHGTGVGLALVKRIADGHGFAISVTSERGRGACFSIDFGLPLAP